MRSLFQDWVLNLVIRGARALYPSGVVPVSETLRRPQGILLMPAETLADVLHALPVARALRRAFPETRISVMTRPASSDLVKDAPGLDEAILCYPLEHPSRWKAFRQIVAELRARNFDTLFSLDHEHDPVKSVVGYLSGARVRIAYADGRAKGLFNVVVDPPTRNRYLAGRGLALLRAVGIDTSGIGPGWSPTEAERRIAGQLVDLRGLRSNGMLAAFEVRGSLMNDPPDLARYSRALCERFGAQFVVLQESPAAAYSQRADLESFDGAEDLACRTIRDVLAILACCDVFLCRDTSLLHFAVAMGVPTVTFLSSTMPASRVPPESDRLTIVREHRPADDELCEAVARVAGRQHAGKGAGEGRP